MTLGTLTPSPVGARLRASLGDLLVIAVWFAVLTAVGALVRAVLPETGTAPSADALLGIDVAAFAATVLPVGLYLAIGEAGARQASLGKRGAGLQVVTVDGERPGAGRIALRTAVKLLPWQLAHIAVARLILGVDEPAITWTTDALSLVIPAVSLTMALADPQRRALHDRVAGTRVIRV